MGVVSIQAQMGHKNQHRTAAAMTGRVELSLNDPAARDEWLRRLQGRAENRARRAEMAFRLPPGFALRMYHRQDGCCAISGIRFNLKRYPKALVKHPFAPSIDRKLSSGAYTPDNVRLVCVAVNFGMGQWGDEVYMTLARAAVAREAKDRIDPDPTRDTDWHARQREKIAAAEALQETLPGPEWAKLDGHIRSLKRVLTMGPERLRDAARKARETRERQHG
jgi:hypothetical protein